MKTIQDAVRELGGAWPDKSQVPGTLWMNTDGYEGDKLGYSAYTETFGCASQYLVGTYEQFEAETARMRNKPEWSEAPEWAEHLCQGRDGEWDWIRGFVQFVSDPDTWQAHGTEYSGNKGEVIGNWKDTLERRPQPERITIQPGDYVRCASVTNEQTFNGLCAAFLSAGAKVRHGGDYSSLQEYDFFGWNRGNSKIDKWPAVSQDTYGARQLTPAQVLNATNAGSDKPQKPDNKYSLSLYRDDGTCETSSGHASDEKLERMLGIAREDDPVTIRPSEAFVRGVSDDNWYESGELPPVGAVCETNDGDQITVLAHDHNIAVCRITKPDCIKFGGLVASDLYPLRTDRERWIEQANGIAPKEGGADSIGAIYDALQSGELPTPGGDQ